MDCFRKYRKPLAVVAVGAFMTATLPAPAVQAALVSTDKVVTAEEHQDARAKVNAFLSRDDVQNEMQALGVSPEEAKARVAALSDEEVMQIQGKIDSMPAGEGLGTVLGVALIVFLVLLITDILGFTHVFGFTNKGSVDVNN